MSSGAERPELSPLKRALLAIERLEAKLREQQSTVAALQAQLAGESRSAAESFARGSAELSRGTDVTAERIAIVGMGCRFPAGNSPEAFWEALRNGVDAVRPRPSFARPGWRATEPDQPFPYAPAGWLDHDVAGFDPGFFGISPREAASIDPQQRLLLEVMWETFEDAGIDPHTLEGTRTGVFVGIVGNDYAQLQLGSERADDLLNAHYASGIGHSMASGRIAWLLGLHGPAITVDTACSSSLVAVHLAVQSLRTGEVDAAVVGGTNLILNGDLTRSYQRSRMLAPDGRCKAFSAAADGFGRGEGCGVVLLKRLADATRDGDRIHAVIRASVTNQDGPSSGLTAPNGAAQAALIRDALAQAKLSPDDIGYIEAHGTGTELGDPIELQALGSVFARRVRPLPVGSVKTNMGHLEAAAGIAGLIKVALMLRHSEIPPHLHFSSPSPHVVWEQLPLEVPTALRAFGSERRAGVSSFGFSGTNAHVVLEAEGAGAGAGAGNGFESESDSESESVWEGNGSEGDRERESVWEGNGSESDSESESVFGGDESESESVEEGRGVGVLVLSARDEGGLREVAGRYAGHLSACGDSFFDVCCTAGAGRAHFEERVAVVAADAESAKRALEQWLARERSAAVRAGRREGPDRPTLAFLYTGQGAQHPGMGWALYQSEPVFRNAIDRCAAILRDHLDVPLIDLLRPDSPAAELVHRTDCTQPALFAIEYALTELWASWGIRPDVVLGHSIGEFAAAHAAGVFSLGDALRVVAARGRLMQSVAEPGRMLAVMATEDVVSGWIDGVARVSIAAVNAPGQVVVSGDVDAVGQIEAMARFAGVETKPLRTSQAFHSPLMDGVVDAFEAVLRTAEFRPAHTRFISATTGLPASQEELADPHYWAMQLRRAVRWADAAASAARFADRALEVGPHPVLAGLIAEGDQPLPVHASLHRDRPAVSTMLTALADLYVHGVDPDWRGVYGRGRRVELPCYPFQRMRLWVDLGAGRREDLDSAHPLLGAPRLRPGPTREFERVLRADAPAFIGDHVVDGRTILPGTAFLEIILAAAQHALGEPVELHGLDLIAPMVFDDGPRRVFVTVDADGLVSVHSCDAGGRDGWMLHATGRGRGRGGAEDVVGPEVGVQDSGAHDVAGDSLDVVRARCGRRIDPAEFYRGLAARGYAFGPRLRGVRELWAGAGEAVARVGVPEECANDPGEYVAHPVLLDAALQIAGAALGELVGTWVPVAIERVALTGEPGGECWAHAQVTSPRIPADQADSGAGQSNEAAAARPVADSNITARVELFDDRGRRVAALDGVTFHEISAVRESADPLFEVRWLPDPDASLSDTQRATLRAHARNTLAAEAEREDARAYDAFVAGLERRAVEFVVQAFRILGWDPAPGDFVTADTLAAELGVAPNRGRLLARALEMLAEEGLLQPTLDGWVVGAGVGAGAEEEDRVEDRAEDRAAREGSPELVLLERCGPHLADNLRGVGDPLELLFPGGDTSDAERLYHDSSTARMFNRAVASAVRNALEAGPSDRPLRILEVGGGTGGTTIHVVDQLATTGLRRPFTYTFTDISPLFVERARRRFDGTPGFEYRLFDLDQPAAAQGFEPGTYDVVIAANCLHAARDLGAAVRNVGGLLRPGGMLLAVEVFAPHRWFDLTVGLTDGWWHFDDTVRDRYPCIPPDRWTRVLRDAGFTDISPIRLADVCDADGLVSIGQGLVLATRTVVLSATEPWLVISDDTGLGDALADGLRDADADVVVATAGSLVGGSAGAGEAEAQAGEADGVAFSDVPGEGRLREVLRTRSRWGGVLHCGAVARDRSLAPDAVAARLRQGTGTLLALARLLARGEAEVGRLCIVTRGGQAVDDHEAEVDPAAAAVWGLARTIRLELPELPCTCVDGTGAWEKRPYVKTRDDVPTLLMAAIAIPPRPELAVRQGVTLVPRLVRRTPENATFSEYRIPSPKTGAIDDLKFVPGSRVAPGPGEVEVRVAASGMNFKDVLNVLGMYPGDAGPLGSECAGVVSAAGPGVDLAPGTPVVAVAGHAYDKHVLADARMVAPVPAGLSFTEAAALPVAYLTAHFALNHLARIGPGDRVLIHAAAGGVGLAACAIAQRAGAQIFATAGSPQKRELLRSMGVAHVFDSRSGSFAEGILQATRGAGVTVVLNSLADELIAPSFEVLAAGGRFLEIGKRGIWTQEQVAALGRGIDYHIIDWGATAGEDPELIARLLREVLESVDAGELAPLPVTTFPVEQIADAMRFMAQGRHTGKIVLTHPVLAADGPIAFNASHTYLITGGTAGLGLETAKHAAQLGAKTLVLVGRNEPSDDALPAIDVIRATGVVVHVRRCDVGSPDDVAALISWIAETLPPLGGIVHAAGTLADRTLQHATWDDFEAVLATKAQAAILLAQHRWGVGAGVGLGAGAENGEGREVVGVAAESDGTDGSRIKACEPFFVGYSSIASVLGSPGQGNHAAANAFLDAFAATRWRDGAVGMSIAWGPWGETGSARDAETLERTRAIGIDAFTTADGLDRLERALAAPRPLVVAAEIADAAALHAMRGDLLEHLADATSAQTAARGNRPTQSGTGNASVAASDTLPGLLAATPSAARRAVLLRRVRDRVRAVLGLPENAPLEEVRPLGELGLDSLLAVELRNVLGRDAERRLPATLLFDLPTVAALTDHLLAMLMPEASRDTSPDASRSASHNTSHNASPNTSSGTSSEPDSATQPRPAHPLSAVESLSDDDVDRLLAEKLVKHG